MVMAAAHRISILGDPIFALTMPQRFTALPLKCSRIFEARAISPKGSFLPSSYNFRASLSETFFVFKALFISLSKREFMVPPVKTVSGFTL